MTPPREKKEDKPAMPPMGGGGMGH